MLDAAFAPVDLLRLPSPQVAAPVNTYFHASRLFHSALKPARILKPPTWTRDQDVVLISFASGRDLRYVRKSGRGNSEHGIKLVGGNGEEIVSDWTYNTGDKDGFNAIMQVFKTEDAY